ncbi:MAG: FAD-binding protein [Candidatus Binatales bacterium]
MLKIAVCIKQIPLVEDANFDPVTRTLRRDGPAVISAFDLRAVSLAIELKKRIGAETVAITMGPPQAKAALTDALAMGLDRAVHLVDRAFAGSDTLATARALAMWLKREPFDLILLGKYSLDSETGQVGPEIAELLGLAQITGVRKLELEAGSRTIRAERESDEGFEEIECDLPALLTCAERVAQPIRIKPDDAERAKSQPIESIGAAELNPDLSKFGFAGSPTSVQDVRVLENLKVNCRRIDGADPDRAALELIAALESMGALQPRAHSRRPIGSAERTSARGRDLWVACETDLATEVTRGSLELLSLGDDLAQRLGGALCAIGAAKALRAHAATLAGYGADHILMIEHPSFEAWAPEAAAEAIAQLVRERSPWGLLICASERGRDWGPRLAARLGIGLTGDAIGIELDAQNRMVALKPAFGGNIVAPILSKTYPQTATIRSGVLELAEPNPSRRAEIEIVRSNLAPLKSRLIAAHSSLDPSIVPLEGAEVVVGIGMGVGGPEGVERVKEFARVMRAGLCATRRVTDAGWCPRQLQVGLTGKTIEPRLYFAIGVRGAPNHTCGIKRAQTVVAINNDPESPIFERANVGIVADWAALMPALIEAFKLRAPD